MPADLPGDEHSPQEAWSSARNTTSADEHASSS